MIRFLRRVFGAKFEPSVDEAEEPVGVAPTIDTLPLSGEIRTDTASLVIFDLSALSHRIDNVCDWWADPKEELAELTARNVLIVDLGSDGFYDFEVSDQPQASEKAFSLRVPSGTIFIGPGEEITGGGNEPDGHWGGYFISVPAGDYSVSINWHGDVIKLGIVPAPPFENDSDKPIRL